MTDALGARGALPRAVEPEIVGLAGAVPTAAEAVVAGPVAVANVADAARAIVLAHRPPRAGVVDTVAGASEAIAAGAPARDASRADASAVGVVNVGLARCARLPLPEAIGHRGEAGALPVPVLAVVAVTVVVAGVAGATWTHFLARGGPVPRLTEA